MSTILQDRFFAVLDDRLTQAGYELLTQFTAANAGTAEIVKTSGFTPVLAFRFHFQAGHNVFEAEVPVWGGSNPRMEIARGAADIGTVISQIMACVESQSSASPGKTEP